jgi:hypothetical protein
MYFWVSLDKKHISCLLYNSYIASLVLRAADNGTPLSKITAASALKDAA